MNLLLISNSTMAGGEYLSYPMPEITKHLEGISEIVFVPYAAVTFSYAEYEKKVQSRLSSIGVKVCLGSAGRCLGPDLEAASSPWDCSPPCSAPRAPWRRAAQGGHEMMKALREG